MNKNTIKNQKYKEIGHLLRKRDKKHICPIDDSAFGSDCLFCECCEKFQLYIKKEFNVETISGKFYFVDETRGKFKRSKEHIDKIKQTNINRRLIRVKKLEDYITSINNNFGALEISEKIKENLYWVKVNLRSLKKQGRIKKINSYNCEPIYEKDKW